MLPWREVARRKRNTRTIVITATVAALSLSLAYWRHGVILDQEVEQLGRNKYLQMELALLKRKVADEIALQSQKVELLDRLNSVAVIKNERRSIRILLNALVRQLPAGIWLKNVKADAGHLLLEGHAQSPTQIAELMKGWARVQGYSHGDLTEVTADTIGDGISTHRFVLTLTPESAIESNGNDE